MSLKHQGFQEDSTEGLNLLLGVVAQAEAAAAAARGAEKPSEPSKDQSRSASGGETPVEQAPPPEFSETYGQVNINHDGFDTQANVANDGRVNIKIHETSRRLSNLLVPALRSQLHIDRAHEPASEPPAYIPPSLGGQPGQIPPPPLNVVIHVVGSRGDVQPFVALGQVLKGTYGHRVRLATHPTFRGFVEENGLEFFSISGDPAELMAFMVKNPGLMPGKDTLRSGDIGKRRKGMYEIVKGCWRSCFESGDGTGVEVSDERTDLHSSFDSGISMTRDPATRPFVADVIIANPPSFAHIHCAEKLGIPLHLMFTMPYSPTQAFPHPLANIQSSSADASLTNFMSYALVEMMTWQGLGDVINRFREKSLGLEPVSLMWAPGMASRLRIPYTYCWSPALIPKPKDWGPHISISGFYFLSLASNFTPDPELASFLDAGPPPVYIGFGSIVVDDPNAMTKLIFEAVKKTGQRALVSKGWGGFGADTIGIPDGVYMLGNVPHDWLFKHVSCVVHHGGAGTTAAGIALGKPTVIVPFFGDQPFWGAMVAKAGAGPSPIAFKQLTSDNLALSIQEALKPSALQRARELGAKIGSEKGCDVGAQSFHEKLNVDSLRCALAPSRVAVWRVKRTSVRLSAFAAATLANEGSLDFSDLKLYRPREFDTDDGPWDPITGATSALLGTIGSLMMGFADFPVEILKALTIKPSEQSSSELNSKKVNQAATPGTTTSPSSSSLSITTPTDSGRSHETQPQIAEIADQSVQRSQPANVVGDYLDPQPPIHAQTNPEKPPASPSHELHGLRSAQSDRPSGQRSISGSPHSLERDKSECKLKHTISGFAHRHTVSECKLRHTVSEHSSNINQIPLEAALGAGKGVGRIVGAGLKSPMDFTLSLAQGFHNAPKLYGDESVRPVDKITGVQSGLKAAGKQFGFGLYDGISGLVTQPVEGAKKEGFAGFLKGFGKGIGGVVLKPPAAFWALPGYTFKGIYKELQKHLGSSVENYIIAARTAQGFDDWRLSSREERLDVVSRWQSVQIELGKEKQRSHSPGHRSPGFMKTRHMTFDERKKLAERKKQKKGQEIVRSASASAGSNQTDTVLPPQTSSRDLGPDHRAGDFEEAIRESVAATSKGDAEQDKLIERAIRASLAELQAASKEGDEDDAIQRAVQASVAEAARARSESHPPLPDSDPNDTSEYNALLHAALQQSIGAQQGSKQGWGHYDGTDSGVGVDVDEEGAAIALKKAHSAPQASDEDIEKAMELSRQAHEENERKVSRERTEEEIVLEYVKRQSLVEQQHAASRGATGDEGGGVQDGGGK